MRMQSAMILMAATGVSVIQDSLEMVTTVQASYQSIMHSYHSNLNFELQISMSVKHKMIRVLMRMLIVLLILSGISAVIVIQDSLEMVTLVLVNCL